MKKSTTTTTTRSGRTRDAPSASVASSCYHHHRHHHHHRHDAASNNNKRQSSPTSSSSSSSLPLRYDFIDAFYGDIEQSLQEDTSSSDHTTGAVIPEVSSLAVAAHHGESQASDSTLPNTVADRRPSSSSSSSSSGGTMTAVTPPPPLTSTKQEPASRTTTTTPLGLQTPPHLKRIQKKMAPKIRAVEPVIRTSLDQVPSTQILGYRDYSASFRDHHQSPRDPTFLQQQQQQQQRRSHHAAPPPPLSSSFTTPTQPRHPRHHSPRHHKIADANVVATTTTIEQKERDRLRQTRSNRVLFVLALIAVICFAMICAVIILVVLNHLAQKSGAVVDDESNTNNNDAASPSSSGRLFLGPGDDDDGVDNFNHGGREPSILPGFSGPTRTSAPTPARATAEMMNDPILSSILDDKPSSPSAASSSSSSSSSTPSSSCPTTTTTGRPSHPPLAGKKGAALTLREEGSSTGGSWVENLPKLIKLNPYWNYSYEAKRIVQQPADVEFIPMIWSGGGGVTADPDDWLADTITTHVVPQFHNGQAHRLLAFHEPDRLDGANMSVDEAIQSWRVLRESTAGLLSLISPGAADPGGPWMSSFMAQTELECSSAEWVAVHWFDIPSFELFRDSLVQYHLQYNRSLLVTEFAPIDRNATSVETNRWTTDDILSFMKEALPWLEETPWIAGYSWFDFGASDPVGAPSALFDAAGNVTACGRYYASVRNDLHHGDVRIGTTEDGRNVIERQQPSNGNDNDNGPVFSSSSPCDGTAWRNVEPATPLPGKKGLAMRSEATTSAVVWLQDVANMKQLNVSWTYAYQSSSFYHELDDPLFLPSVADEQRLLALLPAAADAVVVESTSGGLVVNRILGFDRPDATVDVDNNNDNETTVLSVERALELWRSLEATHRPLVSPTCLDPLGPWMTRFMAAVQAQCRRVDWIGVRWHGPANFHHFREYITSIHETYRRPLMLTEFTLDERENHSVAEALTFLQQAIPWLEHSTFVDGYAWRPLTNTSSALWSGNDDDDDDGAGSSSLTACGAFYASVDGATAPDGNQQIRPDDSFV